MCNNDLVPGFDDEKNAQVKISLDPDQDNNVMFITTVGSIDTYNSEFFMKKVMMVLDKGYRNIVFMNSGVNYLSSTGIGAFTNILKAAKLRGGDIVLVDVQPRVMEIFNLLGFSTFFNFANDRDQAVRIFHKGKSVLAPKSVFPMIFKCPGCSIKLRSEKSGRFRCKNCRVIITIDSSGMLSL